MIVTIKQYKALRRRNARQKIKNDNKIIINLNCSQILQSNLILAKVTPFTRKLSFGKFLLLSYRSHNIFNYY
jgi:murein tripeptide amidase MpaA